MINAVLQHVHALVNKVDHRLNSDLKTRYDFTSHTLFYITQAKVLRLV